MSMTGKSTITRSKHDKENPYVLVAKAMARDKSICPKCKGVLLYLLSLPDDWTVYHSQIADSMGVGEEYITNVLNKLVKAGYCRRTRERVNGRYQAYNYEISESKIFQPDREDQTGFAGPVKSELLITEDSQSNKITDNREPVTCDLEIPVKPVINTADPDILDKLKEKLKKVGCDKEFIREMFRRFELEQIVDGFEYTKQQVNAGKVDDGKEIGYLRRAIENGWKWEERK